MNKNPKSPRSRFEFKIIKEIMKSDLCFTILTIYSIIYTIKKSLEYQKHYALT